MVVKSILAAAALAVSVLPADADNAAEAPREPWSPQGGEEIRFDVLRKGDPFGTHVLSFERLDDGSLKVTNDIALKVKVAFIVAFKYEHSSVEVWRDGVLQSIKGETLKDGDDLFIDARQTEEGLYIEGSGYTGVAPKDTIPASHWNIKEVFVDQILSGETGELLDAETDMIGRETLEIDGETVETTHYRLKSDLDLDLWYDDEGRWVKSAFEARGQNIEYVLTALY